MAEFDTLITQTLQVRNLKVRFPCGVSNLRCDEPQNRNRCFWPSVSCLDREKWLPEGSTISHPVDFE